MAFWLWIVLAVVLVGIVAALFSRVRFRVRYSRSGRLDQLVIVIQALYGLFHYQIILPSIVIRGWSIVYRDKREGGLSGIGTDDQKQNKRKISKGSLLRNARSYRTILFSTKKFRRWARRTMKKVECTRWRLDFRVGTGDAATTAVVSGLLWAVMGCASGAAGQFITLKTSPHGHVMPNYVTTEFSVVWEADFRIRVSSALAAGIKLGTKTIYLRKAIRAWRILISAPKETLN
ncbi:DUF2953 domain-containing protein [Cohnella luojiensis]|uniref:DUF2953 domain-containing protein n=1 Tax=Cohnella luojiensis TaxID=652876 RepID=A0A4Y8M3A2_9BACL|nr:DUF2953 domain-containing protein [Cohnella luojiensis]TFE29947.1 DUF2953 domain-containing protein [Cohnella luojiensis]